VKNSLLDNKIDRNEQFIIWPVVYKNIYDLYKKQQVLYWTAEKNNFSEMKRILKQK
jgi:hypothetical protein